MKKYMYLMFVLALVSCADQLALDEVQGGVSEVTPASDIQNLMEKAKQGNGQAYLKLADCYRDGKGVKKDFVGMLTMVSLADHYRGINRIEDYLDSLPKDSEFKLLVDCMNNLENERMEETTDLIDSLVASDSPDGYAVKGMSVMLRCDSLEAKRLFEIGAEKGSKLAELFLCFPDWRGAMKPNVEKLAALTDRIPWTCLLLAGIYTGSEGNDMVDEELAAYYYLKADQQACLTRRGARWLLSYMESGRDLHLNATDLERIKILAGEDYTETVDTVEVQ